MITTKENYVVAHLTDLTEIARIACADQVISPGYLILREPHIDGFKIDIGFVNKEVVQRSVNILKNALQMITTEITI